MSNAARAMINVMRRGIPGRVAPVRRDSDQKDVVAGLVDGDAVMSGLDGADRLLELPPTGVLDADLEFDVAGGAGAIGSPVAASRHAPILGWVMRSRAAGVRPCSMTRWYSPTRYTSPAMALSLSRRYSGSIMPASRSCAGQRQQGVVAAPGGGEFAAGALRGQFDTPEAGSVGDTIRHSPMPSSVPGRADVKAQGGAAQDRDHTTSKIEIGWVTTAGMS